MYCILLFITKLLIYKCNMSFSRNINSISFDDTRKTPSLYSNQNDKCSYHHSNKRVLKENIAKIDSELLELKKKIYQIESDSVLIPKKVTTQKCCYDLCDHRTTYVYDNAYRGNNDKNYYYSKFCFEILCLGGNSMNIEMRRVIAEKDSIIANLMNDLVLIEGKLKELQKDKEEIESKCNNQEKDKLIEDLKRENERLLQENKNLKVDNVTLYNMCNDKDEIINQSKISSHPYKNLEEENDYYDQNIIQYKDDITPNKYNTYQNTGYNNNTTTPTIPEKRANTTDQKHIREPIMLVDPFRVRTEEEERGEKEKVIENLESYRASNYSLNKNNEPQGEDEIEDNEIINEDIDNNSQKERTKRLLFPNREQLEEDEIVEQEEIELSNNITKSTNHNSGKPSSLNTQGSVNNEKVNQLMSQINHLNEEIMNHKNEIEKSKEEIKQLENENMKLKEEQKKTLQNYSASRESEISLNKIKKEPEDNKQKEITKEDSNKVFISSLKKNGNKSTWLSKMQFNPKSKTDSNMSFTSEKELKGDNLILTVYDTKRLLSFDFSTKKFSLIEFADFSNFDDNFIQEGSLFLNTNTSFYIITGDNYDQFYQFSYSKKAISKLSQLNDNHSFGGILYYKPTNEIFALSGSYNKNVEKYNIRKNNWNLLKNTMTIERSESSYIILNEKYIFALFGFNCPQMKYLNTIEYCDISKDFEWNIINTVSNVDNISLEIKAHFIFGYGNNEFILLGGYDGNNKTAVDKYIDLAIEEKDNQFIVNVSALQNKIFDIDKNKMYNFFGGDKEINGNKESFVMCFDYKNNVHCVNKESLVHDVYYFE